MKRAISFLLVLVMLLGLFPMTTFAEEETALPKVTLTADKTTVKAGEDITLTLSLDKNLTQKPMIWQWNFVWDSTYFDAKSGTVGTAAQPLSEDEDDEIVPIVTLSSQTNYVAPYKSASVTSGNALTKHYLKAGTIATVTLTAKADIEDAVSTRIFMDYITIADSKTNIIPLDNDAAVEWGTDTKTVPDEGVGLEINIAKPVEPIDITVYYADNGQIVTSDKDGETLLNFAPVHVTDMNDDGKLTMYDGFACLHEQYHTNGAAGYTDSNWVTQFWSVDTAMVSYGHNNRWVFSTAEEIADGDSLCLFTYQDQNSWSDLYTYFDSLTDTATAGEEKTFHVNGYSFFGSGSGMDAIANPVGATVTATCGDKTLTTTTDAEGNFKLTFPTAGDWTVLVNGKCTYTCDAGYYKGITYTDAPVTPAQMTVTVEKAKIEPITVYMYYADDDGICVGKDGSVLNFVKLTVGDEDDNGVISFADALTVLHRDYYSGGEAGFAHDNGFVTYIWGQKNSYVNYVINYIYSIGAGQAISDGDELAIWNMLSWGKDLYTYFDKRETTATAGQDATFHVNGFTAGYSKMEADRSITNGTAYPNGATVTATCGDKTLTTTTDANGDFTLNFPSAGEWTVLVNGTCSFTTITGTTVGATVDKGHVIPAMMTVTVSESDYVAPDPVNVSMYYATGTDGIVKGKDGTLLNYVSVTVADANKDGKLTIDDAFLALHEKYYDGTDGYSRDGSNYTFWGSTMSNPWIALNDVTSNITGDTEIKSGDKICAIGSAANVALHVSFQDGVTGTATAAEETTFDITAFSKIGKAVTLTSATATATCGETSVTGTVKNNVLTITFPSAGTYTLEIKGSGMNGNTRTPLIPALMTVTVAEAKVDPDPTPTSGYTVTLDETKKVVVNETVSIDVKVGHTDEAVTAYNAFDMTFSYDKEKLDLTSTEIEGLTITAGDGTVRVQGYGDDRDINSVAFTLKFKAKTTGATKVEVTTAKVDKADHAIDYDAPEATKSVGTTNVTVSGYPVTLPTDFDGASVAEPGQDYNFTAKDKNYNYTFSGTTMGGETVEVVDNGNGSFTIKNVTGAIEVKSEKTGKTFAVKFEGTGAGDVKGESTAQYMTAYEATLTEAKNYSYTVTVTIGGEQYTGYTVSEGKYTIPGQDITGEIVFTVTKTPIAGTFFKVTFDGTGAGDAEGEATVTPDASYSFKLNKVDGYDYEVTATMGGQNTSFTETEDTYTFEKVTGDLVITITKTLHLELTVNAYVELDGTTVALITAGATLGQGQALSYDGTVMFWSDTYNAWCYLVIVADEAMPTTQEVAAKIVATESTYTTLRETKDVNESDVVDINDAQLVYDIYTGKYEDFSTVTMQKFLNADVNADRIVNLTDAAAVVAAIK